ncbi:MAG: hypothetical protein LBH87_02905 [Coriobacteriales bacterium]|nr:hypothetical protein [Coriobacteriales bacterium]
MPANVGADVQSPGSSPDTDVVPNTVAALQDNQQVGSATGDVRPGSQSPQLWVVPPSLEGVRQTRILTFRGNLETPWVTLEGVSSREASQLLVGRYLLAAVEDCQLPVGELADASKQDSPEPFLGFEVHDLRAGYIGKIIAVERKNPQPIWVVSEDKKDKKEPSPFCPHHADTLIPAVEAYISQIEEDRLILDLPDGLLDLNK